MIQLYASLFNYLNGNIVTAASHNLFEITPKNSSYIKEVDYKMLNQSEQVSLNKLLSIKLERKPKLASPECFHFRLPSNYLICI